MRILFLCKRQYTGKDLLDDKYGRLYEIPSNLAEAGFSVDALVFSYRLKRKVERIDNQVSWHGVSWFSWLPRLCNLIRKSRPDLILTSSDAPHVVVGAIVGQFFDIPVIADLYDDYESFALTRIPGLKRVYRWACRKSDHIVVISHCLAGVMTERLRRLPPVRVIGNGVPEGFVPEISKWVAREMLGLPQNVTLVGTAGALSRSRGISDLFCALDEIHKLHANVKLVIAGPRDDGLVIMEEDGVIDLGVIAHDRVSYLFKALDVGVVCNRASDFGQSCHPQKLVEMIACGLPVVAADVGEVSFLLRQFPFSLYAAGNPQDLAGKIIDLTKTAQGLPSELGMAWKQLAEQFAEIIERTVKSRLRK